MTGSAATAPLRHTVLSAARADAERMLAEVESHVAAIRTQTDAQGTALVEQARAEGAAVAAIAGGHDRSQARQRARALVLASERELYDELRRQAHAAAQALRGDPAYERLLARLAAVAREQLGTEALLDIEPAGSGGVIASCNDRLVDYSLTAVVERELDAMGAQATELWS